MKRILITLVLLLFVAPSVFAVNFIPRLLKLSASPYIHYTFDGSSLGIPVKVSGKPAHAIFMVYTKDKGETVGKVTNGHLGWHTVNRIDTCVFWTDAGQLSIGENTIAWNGKDASGAKVPAGTYTYYLWAYDDQNQKQLALDSNPNSKGLVITGQSCIEAFDVKGLPLANPVVYIGLVKWPIGIDPVTPDTDLEYTIASRSESISLWGTDITLDPVNHSMFWTGEISTGKTLYATKYKWVPNGSATVEAGWGENGSFTWSAQPEGAGTFGPGVVGDGKDLLFMSYVNQYDKEPVSELLYLNMGDGSQERIVDLSGYYCSKQDFDLGGQMNGGPSQISYRNGRLFTQGQQACMALALDPYREAGDEIIWVNDNGDYVHDYHFAPEDKIPWMCNDFMVGPYMYTYSVDANEFCAFPAFDMGAVTFGLIGPAGVGIDYFPVAGETAGWKKTARFLDEGTAYDGMYFDNDAASEEDKRRGTWFVGHDSIKGVISDVVRVADASPGAFTVAQNSPNPFNPSTTITFNLARAGKTTVEVYNVAGQKVGTLVNGTMSAGSHSVVWNGAKFSSGVYFYTVRSGSFSRTMKMTLLR